MMASHFVYLLAFSALVSSVFAALLRDKVRDRVRFGLVVFGAFILSAVAVGWLMYPFPS